jgi:uncharacterized Tic20 family protein
MSQELPPPPLPEEPLLVSSDDKIWVILCHLSLLLGIGFVLPLIVYLVKRQDAPATAAHAKEALNFHISVYLYAFISVLLCTILIGFLLLPVIAIGSIVCAILACIKASNGEFYRYPLTLRLVK